MFATVQARQEKPYKVVIQRNGPYQVFGHLPLYKEIIVSSRLAVSESWQRGDQLPTGETYLICRCGQTKNPPFCDGTHIKINFQGDEIAQSRDFFQDSEKTEGPTLTLDDAIDLCIGARFCYKAGGVWKLTEQSDEPEKKEQAIWEACNCPSGRLVEYENATKEAIEPPHEPSLGLIIDPATHTSGPLWLKGNIPLFSADGTAYKVRNRVTLCRCGLSEIKPYCDGTHITARIHDLLPDKREESK